ncbi:MAG: glycosyltransferase [Goleter apudmare HA4340-LM2]|jgi:glycosyltransferase involved in cell wall biosynthesis|nr:glycosyltransferase [Goleter apudmare HA4340-LM2]
MLIWKTNDLNINIASVRYRCLLPLQYLELIGYNSCVYAKNEQIKFHNKSDIIIFVKSFSAHDLDLAQKANKAGMPIILDICDNIFLEEYASPNTQHLPVSQIFQQMSQMASAVVTTGVTLKSFIQTEIGASIPIFVIPDGNETLADVKQAFFFVKWQRWIKLAIYRPISLLTIIKATFKSKLFVYKKKSYAWLHKKLLIKYFNISLLKKKIPKLRGRIGRIVKYLLRIEPPVKVLSNQNVNYLENNQGSNPPFPLTVAVCTPEQKQELNKNTDQLVQLPILNLNAASIGGETKRIIWFGNHGASYGNFGMLNILDIAEHLIKLSHEINFTLLVVSNNYEKYCQHIFPLPFKTDYISWNPFNIYEYISQSNVTIVPNSKSPFSICKSANRAVLSLSLGVPVVATKTPALEIFNDCIIYDEWASGLRAYLSDRQLVQTHVETAKSIIESNYSGEAIANQWANVINQVIGKTV